MRSGARSGLVAATALLCATACSLPGGEPARVAATPAVLTESDLRTAADSLVADREAALRSGDRDAFLATVDDDELQFAATQQRWFDNLARMPLSEVSLEVADAELPGTGTDDGSQLRLPVDFTMKLDGFEDKAVTQRLVYTFARSGDGLALVADRDARADEKADWLPDPWDSSHVVVRQTASILAFFDEETAPYADAVMKDLEASRHTVMAALPDWSGRFVAYDVSDLTGIEERSPMRVWETGGVAYPIYERPGSTAVAAHRFVVNPDVVHNALQREFLLRHELAHIALATRDDHSPRWLAEGAAEYVERSHYPADEQRLMTAYNVVDLGPGVSPLANGTDFYTDARLHYALAGAACTYLVATRGRDVLWELMDAFAAARDRLGTDLTGREADAVLLEEIGLDNRGLTDAALRWAVTGF